MEVGKWDRWAPASGIVFVALLLTAVSISLDYPAADEPAAVQVAYSQENFGLLTAAIVIYAAGFAFLLWFVGTVAARLRAAGQPTLAATAVAAGSVYVGVGLVLSGLALGVLQSVELVEPEVLVGIDLVSGSLINISWLALAVFVLAVGIAVLRTGLLATWFGYATVVAAVLVALVATSWARDGFWSPEGGYLFVGVAALVVWVVTAAVLLLRHPPAHVPAT